ncbi:MFS transporter [Paenibacillus filicis]|uniref:MFS transporter n=1 Tax=Paenibacillus gyeongsangnamensis TaxID=3388067 RepID=A0ABT4QJF4_9BACL|nr:MFS transporter [Paenibacillus filicis]MCZ8517007.1 MFS transporter [Paenibacillus filicis]
MVLLLKNRGALLLLMLNLFLVFTGIGLVIPIMPKFMEDLGITGSTIGLLVAVFSMTQLLFSPLAGRLADSFRRKRMIVIGMIVFALSEGLFGIAGDPVLLFVSRMLGGISAALIMPAVMAYAADVTTKGERATGMGYINAAITSGFIIGPGIGGYIAEFGIRAPFYTAAVAGIIAAGITLFILQESLPAKETSSDFPSSANQRLAKDQQGYVAGLNSAFTSLGNIAGPIVAGFLFDVDINYPYTLACVILLICFGLSLRVRKRNLQDATARL